MSDTAGELKMACAAIVAEIGRRRGRSARPFLVALDGGSGAGKSALAALLVPELEAAWILCDDFFAAQVPDAEWDRLSPEARADVCIDWWRLRAEVVEPLLAGKPARWRAFDFEAGARGDGTYPMRQEHSERAPAPVIVLDGIYSTRPELADLVGLSVLVDAPITVRHARLAAREERGFLEAWHARWDEPEAHYLTCVRPASAFDLVVTTAGGG